MRFPFFRLRKPFNIMTKFQRSQNFAENDRYERNKKKNVFFSPETLGART